MRIVYIDIDSLRPDHLGCYGYARPTSPHIDSVARRGVRFDRYYCSDSPCMPSRAALVTGRFGIRNGVVAHTGAGRVLRMRETPYSGPVRDNQPLPRHLRAHGYLTCAFSNFADRHSAHWFTSGWSQFHSPNLKGGGETAEEVNARLLPWLRDNASRENYFLFVNYWDPHRCYKAGHAWEERFRAAGPAPLAWPDDATIQRHRRYTGPFTPHGQFKDDRSTFPLMPGAVTSRADFEQMIAAYDAQIAYTDHHVGQVLEELDRQHLLDDTAVIISADHGDAFGEHGIYSDHVCADECIHRVPLVVHWPGVTTPGSAPRDELLYNLDLGPSICDLLGLPAPSDWDGRSFADALRGRPLPEPRDHLVWGHALYTVQRAVRTRQHLLIRTYDGGPFAHFCPMSLYDMDHDPYQAADLAGERPDLVAELSETLKRWRREQLAKPHSGDDPFDTVLRERHGSAGHPISLYLFGFC